MEDLIESVTRGNPTEVKVVLASVALALGCYQLLLIAIGYGKLRPGFLSGRAASFSRRPGGAVGDADRGRGGGARAARGPGGGAGRSLAERVADHADGGRRAVQRGDAAVGGRRSIDPVSLPEGKCKEQLVESSARLTSKGQVTVPKAVREALDLHAGDELIFRVERSRAVVAKTPDFLDLAGSVAVPSGKRGTDWDDVLRQARRARGERSA